VTKESPRERLSAAPRRFDFDAAARVLQHVAGSTEPASVARYRSAPHLAYAGADILALVEGVAGTVPSVTTSTIGLVGATGVLPRGYTEQVTAATRERSPSMHAFIDLLADRLVAHFAAAGAKYRPARSAETAKLDGGPDRIARLLLALTGYATPGLAERLACGPEPLLHYSGFFASRPRSSPAPGWMCRRTSAPACRKAGWPARSCSWARMRRSGCARGMYRRAWCCGWGRWTARRLRRCCPGRCCLASL
jgi:predicted component of type VI protein secretion system